MTSNKKYQWQELLLSFDSFCFCQVYSPPWAPLPLYDEQQEVLGGGSSSLIGYSILFSRSTPSLDASTALCQAKKDTISQKPHLIEWTSNSARCILPNWHSYRFMVGNKSLGWQLRLLLLDWLVLTRSASQTKPMSISFCLSIHRSSYLHSIFLTLAASSCFDQWPHCYYEVLYDELNVLGRS